jgi:hypothetical protein
MDLNDMKTEIIKGNIAKEAIAILKNIRETLCKNPDASYMFVDTDGYEENVKHLKENGFNVWEVQIGTGLGYRMIVVGWTVDDFENEVYKPWLKRYAATKGSLHDIQCAYKQL